MSQKVAVKEAVSIMGRMAPKAASKYDWTVLQIYGVGSAFANLAHMPPSVLQSCSVGKLFSNPCRRCLPPVKTCFHAAYTPKTVHGPALKILVHDSCRSLALLCSS